MEYTSKPFIKAKSSSTASIDKIILCEKFTGDNIENAILKQKKPPF
jgi:hypothetical protein